jgi:hypothetical protein
MSTGLQLKQVQDDFFSRKLTANSQQPAAFNVV